MVQPNVFFLDFCLCVLKNLIALMRGEEDWKKTHPFKKSLFWGGFRALVLQIESRAWFCDAQSCICEHNFMLGFCTLRRVFAKLSPFPPRTQGADKGERSLQECGIFPGLEKKLLWCLHLSWGFSLVLGCKTCGVKQNHPSPCDPWQDPLWPQVLTAA